MTMPTLMNCSHSGDGWCLDCVAKLQKEKEDLNTTQYFAYQVFEFLEIQLKNGTWKK